jgi:hypothetical protein
MYGWWTYKMSPLETFPWQSVSKQNVSLTKRLRNTMSACYKTSPDKTSPQQNISVRNVSEKDSHTLTSLRSS